MLRNNVSPILLRNYRLKAHLEEKTQENKHKERAEAITEQDLSSLGWKPVEKNIIDAIQKLEAILGEQNHSAQSISILRQIENSWEESSVRLNLNIKALKSNTIETERIVSCDMEEGLLAAMKDILEGQEFSW